ncbi:hypothetical protein PV11_00039 [Exophiala sideris]|uniref:Uncharacterized protein n=1 Tax=Exophiala sideris TaxID=1016849 RepID=A0A0D1YS32_9EURO|nr:hypothetical protein PV11_00039 [Exophiala sideris]
MMVAIMYRLSACVLLLLRYVNIRENRRRARIQAQFGIGLDDETTRAEIERAKFMDSTDFKQSHFR